MDPTLLVRRLFVCPRLRRRGERFDPENGFRQALLKAHAPGDGGDGGDGLKRCVATLQQLLTTACECLVLHPPTSIPIDCTAFLIPNAQFAKTSIEPFCADNPQTPSRTVATERVHRARRLKTVSANRLTAPIARRFALQPPARLDLVDIAVDVDLQHRRGMLGRTARRFRHAALKPQPPKSSSSTKTSIARTGLSSATASSRNSGSKTPCVRPRPRQSASSRTPDLIHRDCNPTNVVTQPAPKADRFGGSDGEPSNRLACNNAYLGVDHLRSGELLRSSHQSRFGSAI